MKRRDFLKLAAATALAGCATTPSKARVVVIGGGFGGATAAKYIRMWDPLIDVVLVEDPKYRMKILESGGMVPSARGFMSHSMMPAMTQRVPSANSFSVTVVPVG